MWRWRRVWMRIGSCTTRHCRSAGMLGRSSRTRIFYGDQSAQLTDIRQVRSDQAVWSFSSQQATLRRLNKAFDGFFRRVKRRADRRAIRGSRARPGSTRVEWPKDGDGARWLPESTAGVSARDRPGQSRRCTAGCAGRVKTIQVKRQGRRWMLVLSCDDVAPTVLPDGRAATPASMWVSPVSPPPATVSTSRIRAGHVSRRRPL